MTAERLVTNELFLVFAYIVATVFTVSGLDDILYDLFYWVRWLFRLGKVRAWPKLTLAKLEAVEQQKVAVFIPAWQELDVILQMLRNACNTLRYRNYDLFVGTYQNDPDTQREVDIAAKQFPQVHKVVVAADGPTTKADCLNRIYSAMREHEELQGERYAIVVTHDAEDIIHPYSLLLDNYLIPRKDMVQLPVFPAPVPLRYFTYWTYADEFAENHTKDLLVRETSGGFVPCAGVGTAFSRRAFELVGLRGADEVFNERMLTEDYELGLRVRLRQLAAAFVSQRMRLPMPDPQHPERGPQGARRLDRHALDVPAGVRARRAAEDALEPGHRPAVVGDGGVAGQLRGALQLGARPQDPAHQPGEFPGVCRLRVLRLV